jgi:hypothetical protein
MYGVGYFLIRHRKLQFHFARNVDAAIHKTVGVGTCVSIQSTS